MLFLLLACTSTPSPGDSADTADTAAEPELDPELVAALQEALDAALEDSAAPGAVLGVRLDSGEHWSGAAGLAVLDPETAMEPDSVVRIGSITKTFTAALVLLLEEDGALDLDDPIEDWVDSCYEGPTLRQLLQHTGGVYNYTNAFDFDFDAAWTPQEIVDFACDTRAELRFDPGTDYEYSNTGFVLLGMVVEAAGEQPYEEQLRERLFVPLGMDHSFLEGNEAGETVRGYQAGEDITDDVDPTAAWSAGAIASTTGDLLRWSDALHGGAVLSADGYRAMTSDTVLSDGTSTGYGLGMVVLEDETFGMVYGHTGGIHGFGAYLYTLGSDGSAVAAVVNASDADPLGIANAGWGIVLD